MPIPKFDRPTVYDGAKGTLMAAALAQAGKQASDVTEWLNILAPEAVLKAHREYIDAGSQVIQTNTFNGNRFRLADYGLADRVHEVNLSGARLAREAAGSEVAVAGKLGPSGKMLVTGEVTVEELRQAFAEQAAALAEGEVDFFHVETMTDLDEAVAAVEGVRTVSQLPVALTMSFDTGNPDTGLRTMMGVSPAAMVEKATGLGLLAVGVNCGRGLEGYQVLVEQLLAASPKGFLIAKLNAGKPRMVEGRIEYDASPEEAVDYALWCARKGVRLIGMCCGSTPRHVEAIANAFAKGV